MHYGKKSWLGMSESAVVEVLERRIFLSVGSLDTSFDGSGYVLGPVQASGNLPFFSTAEGIAELPNGQTLVAGQVSIGATNGIYVKRYNVDGSVDETFGAGDGYQGANGYSFIGGNLYPNVAASGVVAVARLAVDAAGDIFVGELNAGIVQLNNSGDIDYSFGSHGWVSVPSLTDLAIASGSKTIVSTSAGLCERFTASGTIDNSFGSAGQTQLSIGLDGVPYFGYLSNTPAQLPIGIQSDGDILVGGTNTNGDLAVERLSANGTIDQTFGADGIAAAGFNSFYPNNDGAYNISQSESLGVVDNGDIVVGGVASIEDLNNVPEVFVAAEFLPNGQLNPSFGTDGEIGQITSGNSETYEGASVTAVLPQRDGDIVFTASTADESNPYGTDESSFLLLAVTSSGDLDNSFGNNGELTTQFTASPTDNSGPADIMYAAAETPTGKIVAVGNAAPIDPGLGAVIARYIVEPSPPSLSIANASATEGQPVQFAVTVPTVSSEAISVDYSVIPGSAPVSDFDAHSGTVTIPAGNSSVTISVPTYGDSTGSDEEFTITLASLSVNAVFANGESTESAIGTITRPDHVVIASETSLAISQSDVSVGGSLTLTAQVTGGTSTPTGVVTFLDNGAAIGTATLNDNGDASLQTTFPVVGSRSLTASYGGDANYQASSSSPAIVYVNLLASATTLTAFAQTLVVGQSDTFEVAVAAAAGNGPVPTGSATIFQDGVVVGTYSLQSNGQDYFTLPITSAAVDAQFTASYSGDKKYAVSTSPAVSQTFLTASSASPSIAVAAAPATAVAGQSFNARVPIEVKDTSTTLKGRFTIGLYLDQASEGLDGKQIELKSVTEKTTLRQGKSMVLPFSLKSLPLSIAAGNYHFVTEITDPAGNSNIVTSTQTVEVSKPFVAIVAVVDAITPVSLSPGKTGTIVISIENTGNIAAHGLLSIVVTSADPIGSATELTLSRLVRSATIRPNSTGQYRLRVSIPKKASPGNLTPIAKITFDHITTIVSAIVLAIG